MPKVKAADSIVFNATADGSGDVIIYVKNLREASEFEAAMHGMRVTADQKAYFFKQLESADVQKTKDYLGIK